MLNFSFHLPELCSLQIGRLSDHSPLPSTSSHVMIAGPRLVYFSLQE